MHRASSFLEIRFPSIRLKRGMVTRQGHRFVLNVAETADSNVPAFCLRTNWIIILVLRS